MLRLNPDHPLLWRDPHTVQFGVDALVTVEVIAPWVERLLHALRAGIRKLSYDVIAHGVGAPRDQARELLAALTPVLAPTPIDLPGVWIDPGEDLPPLVALRLAEALRDEGITVHEGSAAPPFEAHQAFSEAIAIVISAGVATASRSAPYLREDRPHLPISFDGNGVTAGPMVVPGVTACLTCRDEHDRERCSFWAVVHTQLMAHRPATVPLRRIADAAESVHTLLQQWRQHGPADATRSIRISGVERHHESHSVHFHEECQCRSLPESVPVPAPLDLPIATTSLQEFARLA